MRLEMNIATQNITALLKSYAADESGATAIEYGLIAALVGVGIITGASTLAKNNDSAWNNMAAKVEAVG
jgi:pilus assembly protein Flp/PilA